MNKRIIVSLAALLIVGAGAFYTIRSGYVQVDRPTQEQLDAAASQSAESATRQTAAELAESRTAQAEELEDLREQVEQLNEAMEQKSETTTPPQISEMQVIQVSSPASAASKPIAAESKSAPVSSAPPAKVQNTGTVFEGYTVTVTDKKTPAVRAAGIDWPITTYYFISASGERLGSITGTAMNGIIKKYGSTLGANEEWEFWFAERFNDFRGLSGGGPGSLTNSGGSQSEVLAGSVDTDAYADEVIDLINQKRESKGLNALEISSDLMSHAEVRAKELSTQYSHVRPNGTKETSECIVMRRDSPSAAVKAWLESDPHRDAILNESGRFPYQTIGSGCYQDENGVLYWVITFDTGYNGGSVSNKSATGGTQASKATYNLNATALSLTAGEEYQLSVETSIPMDNMRVEWSASKLSDGILSINSDGYISTNHRSGMSSATATLTVSAKIYVADSLVKTLSCKVTVMQ